MMGKCLESEVVWVCIQETNVLFSSCCTCTCTCRPWQEAIEYNISIHHSGEYEYVVVNPWMAAAETECGIELD